MLSCVNRNRDTKNEIYRVTAVCGPAVASSNIRVIRKIHIHIGNRGLTQVSPDDYKNARVTGDTAFTANALPSEPYPLPFHLLEYLDTGHSHTRQNNSQQTSTSGKCRR